MAVEPFRRILPLAVLLVVAVVAAGAAQEYTIGPGDILKIVVWGHDDLSREYPVTPAVHAPFPLVGQGPAVGLLPRHLGHRRRGKPAEGQRDSDH